MNSNLSFPLYEYGRLIVSKNQNELYGHMTTALVDDNEEQQHTHSEAMQSPVVDGAIDTTIGLLVSGISPNLTPTRHKQKLHRWLPIKSRISKVIVDEYIPKRFPPWFVLFFAKWMEQNFLSTNTDKLSCYCMCFANIWKNVT
jgi:hypothetical protein